jgi:hypothetical protein
MPHGGRGGFGYDLVLRVEMGDERAKWREREKKTSCHEQIVK